MPKAALKPEATPEILDQLERHYGPQSPNFPTDPYQFIVWWHCGYPASDTACAKGWEALTRDVGIEPAQLLAATPARLAAALRAGGMVPELRAQRLKEIAARIQNEFGGELSLTAHHEPRVPHPSLQLARVGFHEPIDDLRRSLKRFPNIADPGADRILLFAGVAPIAAVPSNCPQVLVRIRLGQERENYGTTYREAQELLEQEVPRTLDARTRAYLLLKRHGQELCKRGKPKCDQCPVSASCAFFGGKKRGR